MENGAPASPPVRNLPLAHGRTFATLDEYLAHLRRNAGTIDMPWYREIRPGVYELVSSDRRLRMEQEPEPEQRVFTREELMRRFGFDR